MFGILGYFSNWTIKRLLADVVNEKIESPPPEAMKAVYDATHE